MDHRITESLGVETQAAAHAEPRVRFAEWHAAPPKPALLSQRLRRVHWERFGPVALVGVPPLLVFASAAVLNPGLRGPLSHLVPLLLLAVMLPVGFVIWLALRSRRAGEEVRDLMELPPSEPQYPMEVRLQRNGVPYGTDIGLTSFTGGVLHFQGRRCAFDLPRGNVLPVSKNALQCTVAWSHGQLSGKITLAPYDEITREHRGYRDRFYDEFEAWTALECCEPGDMLLPPLSPSSFVVGAFRWLAIGFYLSIAVSIVMLLRDVQLDLEAHRIAQLADLGHGGVGSGMVDHALLLALPTAIISTIVLIVAAVLINQFARRLKQMADTSSNPPV